MWYLVQVDLGKVEPFSDENDDGATELVDAALIEAANARHFAQIFRFGTTQ